MKYRIIDAFALHQIKKCYGKLRIRLLRYTNLGNAYFGPGDFKKAAEFYLKAEKIFKETGKEHHLKVIYKNMEIAYGKMNMRKEAKEYKRKSEKIKFN